MKSLSPLSKKAQLNSLAPAVITLVIAAVFLVLGLIVLQSMRDTDIVTQANSASFTNETLTTVTETGEVLACGTYTVGVCATPSMVTNASSGTVIPTSNYTFSGTTCRVSFTSGGQGFNNSNWNVTYSCTYGDEAYTASNETVVGLGTFADFWEIIVLAVVITIVIGLLIGVFGGRRER